MTSRQSGTDRSERDGASVHLRPWVAVAGGLVAGVVLAAVVVIGWSLLRGPKGVAGQAASRPDSRISVFRLRSDGPGEILLAPAGPDATGEPALSRALFPDETPARRFASVLVANTSAAGAPFEVDLAAVPFRAEPRDGGSSFNLEPLPKRLGLSPTVSLRLRSLGGDVDSVRVSPGTLRRFLVALPPGRTLSDVSVVQWGERSLERALMDLETLHQYREAPGGVTR